MQTKPLIYGIVGFLAGGLLVAVAATTFDKSRQADKGMTMEAMVTSLQDKTGDDFDKAFVREMIKHHQGAIDMAKLSADRAKHQEIKDLSNAIIETQQKEIADMHHWQTTWGYKNTSSSDMGM